MPFFQSSYNRFDIADSDPDMAIHGFYADLEPLLQLAYNSIDGISADRGQSSKFKSVNEFTKFSEFLFGKISDNYYVWYNCDVPFM